MTALVLDASAVAAWIMPSQATTASESLLLRIGDYDLIAPDVFVWEVGNLFLRQSRRGLPLADTLDVLGELGIGYAEPSPPEIVLKLTEMAAAMRLSLFDTAYLSLAADLDAPLASRDGGLIAAASRLEIQCLDLREVQTP